MPKLNHHQFRQALGSLIGHNAHSPIWFQGEQEDPFKSDFEAAVDAYDQGDGGLSCPASLDSVFIIPERIPIFSDIQKKKRSLLVQILMDRYDDTGLVVDSYLVGKEALHLVKLVQSTVEIDAWLTQMHPVRMSLTIRPIDEQHKIMIANLGSFVSSGAGC